MYGTDYELLSVRLKLLAHPERLRILDAIRRDSECVCHLEALLDKPQPYVSQSLGSISRALRNCLKREAELTQRREVAEEKPCNPIAFSLRLCISAPLR